ncbi:MAG: DUF393 domain-containing protein [Gloeomargarita sp. SKYBB_i_bin120]|nr:DUF393 domain-containing protein [Gloeomargarita sp. SKYG98]MCS7293135.1 DUF393 domain-containing protein [Gloeomargarita sp. SKYB120]MDW8178700.1 DUF393 domain-containing protein [Gloeomargarita sp. SKYBB_i_bin120]
MAPPWKIKLLYDGDCPLCLREVEFLRRRDRGRGLVAFVDIAAPDYDPQAHGGIDFATAMSRIHAILPDGTVLRDMAVFRQVYEVLGLGWVYRWTGWPLVKPLVDRLYAWWAKHRLALTGRPDLDTLIGQRCSNGRCERP